MKTTEVTDEERSIIEHSLGIEHKKGRQRKPYRNYYCASAGDARLESLADRGLMKRGRKINEGADQYYLVTESGAAAVGSKLPKEPVPRVRCGVLIVRVEPQHEMRNLFRIVGRMPPMRRQIPEPCPNDGTPMEPDTWRDDAMVMAEKMMDAACMSRINELRENEGSSVVILSDNPAGGSNCAIEVIDEWTGWKPKFFEGETILGVLTRALVARESVTP